LADSRGYIRVELPCAFELINVPAEIELRITSVKEHRRSDEVNEIESERHRTMFTPNYWIDAVCSKCAWQMITF